MLHAHLGDRLRRGIGRFASTLTTREASNYFKHAGYA
jgi:hypothetical protein